MQQMAQWYPGGSPPEGGHLQEVVREWRGALDDDPEMLEVLVEAAKDVENDDTVVDEQPELD
jgi:hypothetical protein